MDIKLFDKRYVYLEWSDELEGKDCILAQTYQNLKDFVNSGDEGRIFKVDKGTEKPFTNHWKECDFCYYDPNYKVKKAWIEGKTIQQECGLSGWKDYINLPRTNSYFYNINWDAYEWRIKPSFKIESTFFVNAHNHDDVFELEISLVNDCAIFRGTKKQCKYIIKKVDDFIHNNCACRCKYKGSNCHNCTELLDFIKGIEFKTTRRMTNRELSEYLSKGNGEMKTEYFSPNALNFISTIYTSYGYLESTENEDIGTYIYIRDFGSDEWREPLVEV